MNVINDKIAICFRCFVFANKITLCIIDAIINHITAMQIIYISVQLDYSLVFLNFRSYHKTFTTIIVQVKMCFFNADNIYITVNTTVKGKVGYLWIYFFIGCIINQNADDILTTHISCNIYTPARISAIVMC